MKKLAITALTLWILVIVLIIFFPFFLMRSCEISEKKDKLAWQRFYEIVDVCDEGAESYFWVNYGNILYQGGTRKGDLEEIARKTLSQYGLQMGVEYEYIFYKGAEYAEDMGCFSFEASFRDGEDRQIKDRYFIAVCLETLEPFVVLYYPDCQKNVYLVSCDDGAFMVCSENEVSIVDASDGSIVSTVGGENWNFQIPSEGYVLYSEMQTDQEGVNSSFYGVISQQGRAFADFPLDQYCTQITAINNGIAKIKIFGGDYVWMDLSTGELVSEEKFEAGYWAKYLKENCYYESHSYDGGGRIADANGNTILDMKENWLIKKNDNLREIVELRVIDGLAISNSCCFNDELYLMIYVSWKPDGFLTTGAVCYLLFKLDEKAGTLTKLGCIGYPSGVRHIYRFE